MSKQVQAQATATNDNSDDIAGLRQQNADLRGLLSGLIDAGRRINDSFGTSAVLDDVIESARKLTGARCGAILTFDESGGVRDVCASGMTAEEIELVIASSAESGLVRCLTEASGPVRLPNIGDYLGSTGLPEFPFSCTTFLGFQIRNGEAQVAGAFLADKESGEEFTGDDQDIAGFLVGQIERSIASASGNREEAVPRADMDTLIDITPVGVSVFDAKTGRLVSYNQEFKRFAGQRLETDWEETFPRSTLYRADGRRMSLNELPLYRVFQFGETVRAEDIIIEFPDGGTSAALLSAAPMYSERGDLVAALVVTQDLTPVIDRERVRADFLALVNEELRLPLAAIKGSAVALREITDPWDQPEARQLTSIIDQQVDLMRTQVNSIMELTFIENGTLSITPQATHLSEFLDGAIEEFTQGHSGIGIETALAAGLPMVNADTTRMGQVLNNLLYSVARHTTDLASVRVSASVIDIYVVISVSARSGGVSPMGESHPLVERLVGSRLNEIREAAGAESLALAMCKGIIEAQGGRMRVQNEDDTGGMTIAFTIPIAEESEAETDAGAAGAASLGDDATGGGQSSVLMAIDDARTEGWVRRILDEAGYTTVAASDFDDLDRVIRDEEPSLILLDLSSGKPGGFRLTQRLSTEYEIPIIVLSGQGEDENIEPAFENGADDYIVKPFSSTELVARIMASLRKRGGVRRVDSAESFVSGDVAVDYGANAITVAGNPVHLTATEYKLLVELSTRAGRVASQDELLRNVWGPEYLGESQLLRAYIRSLRRKLGDDARDPSYIFTVHGIGYRMAEP